MLEKSEPCFIATARAVRTGTFLWTRGARPQKCPKQNGDCYNFAQWRDIFAYEIKSCTFKYISRISNAPIFIALHP
jgi:hypothetical protein